MEASPARCPCHRWAWVTVQGIPRLLSHCQMQWGAPCIDAGAAQHHAKRQASLLVKRTLGSPDIFGTPRQMSIHAHESHNPACSSEYCHCVLCSQ